MAHWTRSFTGGSYAANWRVTLDYYITSQDVANNRSYVVLKNYVYSTGSAYSQWGNWQGRLYINGGEVNYNGPYANVSNGWYHMNTWEGWIGHNNDGTKSIDIGNRINAPVNEAGYAYINWTLPTIPRHGNITAVSGNFNDTNYNPWIEFTAPAGGQRVVWFELPNLTGTTRYAQRGDWVNSRYTWTLTEAEMNALRSATKNVKSTTIRFKYANNVGGWVERSADRTFSIIDANPIFSDISYKDINPDTVAITGDDQYIIQGKSTLEAKVAVEDRAEPQKYATMSKYVFNVAGVSSEAPYSSTEDVLKNMGIPNVATDQTLSVTAVDSRGNQTIATKNVSVVPYASPVITATAERLNNFEATTTIRISGSISLLTIGGTNKNAVSTTDGVQYRRRESGGTWGSWISIPSTTNASTGEITVADFTITLDNTKAFDIEFSLTDALETTVSALTLSAGNPILFVGENDGEPALGINKMPDQGALDVAGDIYSNGSKVATETQEAWIEPSLQNGWVNYDSPTTGSHTQASYMKDGMGFVHLKGLIKSGTLGTPAFTLPAGYRTDKRAIFVVLSNNSLGRLNVDPNGGVYPMAPSVTNWVSLDGISFRAEQ